MRYLISRFFSKLIKVAGYCTLLAASTVQANPKTQVSPDSVENMCQNLYQTIKNDNFSPDLIIGISRGGLIPLGYLAGEKMFDIRNTLTISVKSYEKDKQGLINLLLPLHSEDIQNFKSILIVDDIVDTGKTFAFVASLFKDTFKNSTVKTASLFYKPKSSVIKPDYYVEETESWIVFPWEN